MRDKNLPSTAQFAKELVTEFYPTLRGKLISEFYALLTELYLPLFHKRDLDLLRPTLMQLERLQVS